MFPYWDPQLAIRKNIHKRLKFHVGYEVPTAVVFWVVTPCSLLGYQRFGVTCCLLIRWRRMFLRNIGGLWSSGLWRRVVLLADTDFSEEYAAFIFKVRWRQHVPPKRRYLQGNVHLKRLYPPTGIRGVTAWKPTIWTSPYTVMKWDVVWYMPRYAKFGVQSGQRAFPYIALNPVPLIIRNHFLVWSMRELRPVATVKSFQISTLRWRSGFVMQDGVSAFLRLTCRTLSGVEMGHTLIVDH
jgi:hypothetical protein